ncbi:hypothetical protein BS47DRAFT_1281198, partial [Hydnum rufescens UP504]
VARSNDHPNLHYAVHKMQHRYSSFEDLAFLIPDGLKSSNPCPMKFVVYGNSRNDTQGAATYLHSWVSKEMQHMIPWLHSGMSDSHQNLGPQKFHNGEWIGMVCTDALGLGMDLKGAAIIVQYGV